MEVKVAGRKTGGLRSYAGDSDSFSPQKVQDPSQLHPQGVSLPHSVRVTLHSHTQRLISKLVLDAVRLTDLTIISVLIHFL